VLLRARATATMTAIKLLLWLGLGISSGLSAPTLFWSSNALPGETLLIGKSGTCAAPCEVKIAPAAAPGNDAAAATITVLPAQVNNASVMVTLPTTLTAGAYSVTVGGSAPLLVNAPDLWWVHGDAGNESTVGGWLRVFGRSITLGSTSGDDTARRVEAKRISGAIAAAAQVGDLDAVSRLLESSSHRTSGDGGSVPAVTLLLLTDIASGAALAPIPAHNSSSVEAFFSLTGVPAGTYRVRVSNGHATAGLDSFVSPASPHVTTILSVVDLGSVSLERPHWWALRPDDAQQDLQRRFMPLV
jgi:hypothetical protein